MKMYLKKAAQFVALFMFAASTVKAQSTSLFGKFDSYHTLSEMWELNSDIKSENFLLTAYKPFYILPFRFSSHRRELPFVIDDVNQTDQENQISNVEALIQFSFKTKLAHRIFGAGDLWLGYTQRSFFQVYNGSLSRPFRETNYEPEIIINFPLKFNFLGMQGKMLGLSLNHQSNGREGTIYTRSWNRIIMNVGFEQEHWSLVVRPWFAFAFDENPDIENYVGRGDATFIYRWNKNLFTIHGQHSLRTGSDNRGQIELDWAFPIKGNLRGYFQFVHGYGDDMIDYRQKHTIAGIGMVFSQSL
jgi:phospholipase A1/A2